MNFFKGKLLVNAHLKSNLSHKERFYVSYDEFHPNRPENRIIKATLLKLQRITSSAENAKEIRQLLSYFELVEESTNYQKDFAGIVIDRNTSEYELILKWSKIFLNNESFTTFAGSTTSKALLFPMEAVYESYVSRKVRTIMGEAGWNVSCQDKGYYLFNEPKPQFALRPDIVLKRDGRVVILDAKWKRLTDNERANYGISQADMYQMFAYSKKYNTKEIWLLYPVTDEMRGHKPIRFTSIAPIGNDAETVVNVFFVDVAHIDEPSHEGSIYELLDRIEGQ